MSINALFDESTNYVFPRHITREIVGYVGNVFGFASCDNTPVCLNELVNCDDDKYRDEDEQLCHACYVMQEEEQAEYENEYDDSVAKACERYWEWYSSYLTSLEPY